MGSVVSIKWIRDIQTYNWRSNNRRINLPVPKDDFIFSVIFENWGFFWYRIQSRGRKSNPFGHLKSIFLFFINAVVVFSWFVKVPRWKDFIQCRFANIRTCTWVGTDRQEKCFEEKLSHWIISRRISRKISCIDFQCMERRVNIYTNWKLCTVNAVRPWWNIISINLLNKNTIIDLGRT